MTAVSEWRIQIRSAFQTLSSITRQKAIECEGLGRAHRACIVLQAQLRHFSRRQQISRKPSYARVPVDARREALRRQGSRVLWVSTAILAARFPAQPAPVAGRKICMSRIRALQALSMGRSDR